MNEIGTFDILGPNMIGPPAPTQQERCGSPLLRAVW